MRIIGLVCFILLCPLLLNAQDAEIGRAHV